MIHSRLLFIELQTVGFFFFIIYLNTLADKKEISNLCGRVLVVAGRVET